MKHEKSTSYCPVPLNVQRQKSDSPKRCFVAFFSADQGFGYRSIILKRFYVPNSFSSLQAQWSSHGLQPYFGYCPRENFIGEWPLGHWMVDTSTMMTTQTLDCWYFYYDDHSDIEWLVLLLWWPLGHRMVDTSTTMTTRTLNCWYFYWNYHSLCMTLWNKKLRVLISWCESWTRNARLSPCTCFC